MAQKTFKINGADFTSYTPRAGYTVAYKNVDGGSGGTMLDGSTTTDIIARKAIITFPLMPLTEQQAKTLIAAVFEYDYPEVYYFDPLTRAYREIETIAEEPSAYHAGVNINSDDIWKLGEIVFTER